MTQFFLTEQLSSITILHTLHAYSSVKYIRLNGMISTR